jgi:hypothetical protein
MTTQLDPAALEVLATTPAVLRAMLGRLPDATVSAPGAEGWSPKDVVAHLASIQRPAVIERIGALLSNEGATVPNVDEDGALAQSGLRGRPLEDVLEIFAELRAEAMTLLRSIEPAQLGQWGKHSVAGEISVADTIHHLAYHDLLHIAQVARLLYVPIERERGAMRMF